MACWKRAERKITITWEKREWERASCRGRGEHTNVQSEQYKKSKRKKKQQSINSYVYINSQVGIVRSHAVYADSDHFSDTPHALVLCYCGIGRVFVSLSLAYTSTAVQAIRLQCKRNDTSIGTHTHSHQPLPTTRFSYSFTLRRAKAPLYCKKTKTAKSSKS